MDNKTLDGLSFLGLKFLLERTDFSEPYLGFGIATEMYNELMKAYKRKCEKEGRKIEDWPLVLDRV